MLDLTLERHVISAEMRDKALFEAGQKMFYSESGQCPASFPSSGGAAYYKIQVKRTRMVA